MAVLFVIVHLVIGLLACSSYSSQVHRTCLSCPPVSHPRECRAFVEVWSHERCYAEHLLINGSYVYKFGYKTATECARTDGVASPRVGRGDISRTGTSLCHECCTESLCNLNLCTTPSPAHNNTHLACLLGDDVRGLPINATITYCDEGEQCYAGRLQHGRPNELHYGCASQVLCAHLLTISTNIESSSRCRKCCSQHGCNAHICNKELQDPHSTNTTRTGMFTDCWDLRSRGGFTRDGPYDIYPAPAHARVRVRCDMTTDGGGWTVLQRRYDGSLSFTRTFQEYQDGFGDVSSEYWLGLDEIHYLTTQRDRPVQVRYDVCTFDGQAGYAEYNGFYITPQIDMYRFYPGTFVEGSLQYRLTGHTGLTFQTTGRCANHFRGGWWYLDCHDANLNGGWYNGEDEQGIAWRDFGSVTTTWPSLKSSEMKIRPVIVASDTSRPYICPS